MEYKLKDITKLIDLATEEERKSLANVLNIKSDQITGDIITKQLWWKYQTPLGYFALTPTFDKIVKDVTSNFVKISPEMSKLSCWGILHQLTYFLFDKMFYEMSDEKKDKFFREILNEKQIEELCADSKNIMWDKIRPSVIISLIPPYTVSSIVSTQLALAMIGSAARVIGPIATTGPVISLGPVGWVLVAWGLNDLLGTNWKQILPGVLYINCIYERLKQEDKISL